MPGLIPTPNPYGDLSNVFPDLGGANQALGADLLAKLGGNISPGTMAALQNAAAAFGVRSGMPGSGLQWNNLFGNIAGFAENQTQQGIQDYNQTIPTISRTQTVDPALQTTIAGENALNLAAPTPSAVAQNSQSLFNKYLASLSQRNPATGSSFAGPTTPPYAAGPWAGDVGNPPFQPSPIYSPGAGGGATSPGGSPFNPTVPYYGPGSTAYTGTSGLSQADLDSAALLGFSPEDLLNFMGQGGGGTAGGGGNIGGGTFFAGAAGGGPVDTSGGSTYMGPLTGPPGTTAGNAGGMNLQDFWDTLDLGTPAGAGAPTPGAINPAALDPNALWNGFGGGAPGQGYNSYNNYSSYSAFG